MGNDIRVSLRSTYMADSATKELREARKAILAQQKVEIETDSEGLVINIKYNVPEDQQEQLKAINKTIISIKRRIDEECGIET